MNREQKAAAIAEIAAKIDESQAVFAVDYRGISVSQAAELRSKLREGDASFQVVKNSLTDRAAAEVGAEELRAFLAGPTALTFVRGDVATAAKALADYSRATQLLPFKGGLMEGGPLDVEQIRALSRLPARDVLYGQLVGVVASPVSGLVRTMAALLGGLASALGQVREKKESGEIPAGAPTAAQEPAAEETDASAEETAPSAEETEASAEPADAGAETEASAEETEASAEPADAGGAETEASAEEAPASKAEPASEPAHDDDNQAGASAQEQSDTAETPTKED